MQKTAILADGTPVSCVNERYAAPGDAISDFYAGTFTVGTGTGQLRPGTYEVRDVKDCYWERIDAAGRTIDNGFVVGAPRVEVTIGRADAAFTNKGCGHWTRVGA